MRPADILSRAGREQGLLALDIGVASPEAGGAGDDCVAAMEGRKKAFYGEAVLAALHAEGITYTPLIISCYHGFSLNFSGLPLYARPELVTASLANLCSGGGSGP